MQNFGQNPNPFMVQPNPYMGQPNPYMGQYADPFMGQPNPFMGQAPDPSMGQEQGASDMQQGFPSYGHQWAQYEDQAAQYTAEAQAAQEAEAAQQAADGNQGDTAQQTDTPEEDVDPYAVDESDIGIAMPLYGYDANFMTTEFGAAPVDPYGYGYADPYAMQQPLIDGNQPVVEQRWRAHPVLVFSLMLICFPIGLAMMLFFTDWGVFAKSYTTLFVLAMALTVYEILVYKQVIAAPSIVKMVMDLIA